MGDHDAVARVVIFPLSLTSATAHRVTIASARDRRQRQHHGDSGRQARPGNGPYHYRAIVTRRLRRQCASATGSTLRRIFFSGMHAGQTEGNMLRLQSLEVLRIFAGRAICAGVRAYC
jgi:hypothetical protein